MLLLQQAMSNSINLRNQNEFTANEDNRKSMKCGLFTCLIMYPISASLLDAFRDMLHTGWASEEGVN